MSIGLHGGLKSAIPDTCKNYDPIKSEPTSVWSEKSGRLHKCRNWKNDHVLVSGAPAYGSLEGACLYCDNWQTPEGEYVNRLEDIALDFYKKDVKKFIKYFKKRIVPDKKKIIKKIFECDFTNEEVIKYLDEKESGIIREIGISLI